MALQQLTLDVYEENKVIIYRFKNSKGDYHYNDKTNLTGFEAASASRSCPRKSGSRHLKNGGGQAKKREKQNQTLVFFAKQWRQAL
jgi:hypothetical protein